jgi:PAS domain S-box-containing protein
MRCLGKMPMEFNWDISKTLLHLFPGGSLVFGADGNYLLSNEAFARMTGYAAGEIASLQAFIDDLLIVDTDHSLISDMYQKALDGKAEGPAEIAINRKDGRVLFMEIYISPILGENGRVVAVGIIAFETTERKLLEKEHEEMQLEYLSASRMATLGELARGIAHNINNPLAGLFGYLELLAEDHPDDERIRKCVDQCSRISDIARNLAYHGRNTEHTERAPTDLNELISETLALIGASKLYDNLVIETNFHDPPVMVMVNPGDITQVLLNLLRNARDAVWGKTDGRICVRTSVTGDEAEMSVSDNGHGIPKELHPFIFDPFFSTKSREHTPDLAPAGNGLGLSTSKHLIAQNKGRIDFTSEVDKGSTFRVYLPRANG